MPLISLYTNCDAIDESNTCIELSQIVADQLDKPLAVTMARVFSNTSMSMGTKDKTALFEIEAIELNPQHAEPLTKRLCEFAQQFDVSPDMVFVKLHNVPRGMWGGNGKVY